MAIMIPEQPMNFDPASQEDTMFEALAKLSDDYYVFHSLRITETKNNEIRESETDFVILNREKGVICLEAKAGAVRCENGIWLYGNGTPMRHGSPFTQASVNKYKLMKFLENRRLSSIADKCRFLHGVWFPGISDNKLKTMTFSPEGNKKLVLTKEALENPEKYLDTIYALGIPGKIKTDLSKAEFNRLLKEGLCPSFNVVPSVAYKGDLKKIVFNRLLSEQAGILNFLDEQKTVAINGSAGTGKTMIAVEKARRHAAEEEKVLFLCFNTRLKDFLAKNFANDLVSYYTIDGFACMLCNTVTPEYDKLKKMLEDYYISGTFPYKHVIIDEGQDFGREILEETDIIQLLHDIIADTDEGGTFYVFYDRLQMVQAKEMPKFISDSDCKLTLYRNCRNTENIASTALSPLTEKKPKLFERAVKGAPAQIHFCNDAEGEKARIDTIIEGLGADGFKDIVILTCKTEAASVLGGSAEGGKYREHLFTTCRKFKGLEADAVILIDVDKSIFEGDNVLLFYVGASRARIKLEITAVLSEDECKKILISRLNWDGKGGKARKNLASALKAVGKLDN